MSQHYTIRSVSFEKFEKIEYFYGRFLQDFCNDLVSKSCVSDFTIHLTNTHNIFILVYYGIELS